MTGGGRGMSGENARVHAIYCQECWRPWGVVLPRNYTTGQRDAATDVLLSAYRQWCEEVWADDVTEAVQCPPMDPPKPAETAVVHVTDKDCEWLESRGVCVDGWPESAAWMEVEWMGLPAWFVGRRQRVAIRWDCCDLADPRYTDEAEKIDAHRGLVLIDTEAVRD